MAAECASLKPLPDVAAYKRDQTTAHQLAERPRFPRLGLWAARLDAEIIS